MGVGKEELACTDSYGHRVDSDVVQNVVNGLGRRMPGIAGAQSNGGWSGLFTVTPDSHPISGGRLLESRYEMNVLA